DLRLVGIAGPDLPRNRARQGIGICLRADDQMMRSNAPLEKSKVEFRTGLILYSNIPGIRDDADNLIPLRSSLAVRGHAKPFSNDVQRAPIFSGHRFIHHDDFLRALLVLLVELTASHERNA